MTRKERFLTALKVQQPDRVPLFFGDARPMIAQGVHLLGQRRVVHGRAERVLDRMPEDGERRAGAGPAFEIVEREHVVQGR